MLAGDDRQRLVARYPPEPLVVTGDRQRLKQTALIALDNAIKYSQPASPIEVELGRRTVRPRSASAIFGDAIPPEDLPYVFERFYRGRQGKPAGGSGLGLSIANWIVEKHGGTIALDSRRDGVTELEFRLQLA